MNQAKELKDTLNLPQTAFPMRANAVQRSPKDYSIGKILVFMKWCRKRTKMGILLSFMMGLRLQMEMSMLGSALNKILKDTILRYKSARGY